MQRRAPAYLRERQGFIWTCTVAEATRGKADERAERDTPSARNLELAISLWLVGSNAIAASVRQGITPEVLLAHRTACNTEANIGAGPNG